MSDAKTCPKCSQAMQPGFVADKTRGSVDVGRWYEGAPQLTFLNGVKIDGLPSLPVGAYRCAGCGFLEFYALPEHAAHG
jgi:hypothetical protein